jgi:hypothetical protein
VAGAAVPRHLEGFVVVAGSCWQDPSPLVILLKPGEWPPALPPAPAQVVVGRPFRLADLVERLEHPPGPPAEAPATPGRTALDLRG